MSSRPRYDQFHSPGLTGLGPLARAQVCNAINNSMLAEIVDQAGGEIFLEPGFSERVGSPSKIVGTRFLDDGRYRIWTEPMTPEWNHPGEGTRWQRMEGPRRRGQALKLYEVETCDAVMATLRRIEEDGTPVTGAPLVSVRSDLLRRGAGGWKRWVPPLEVVEHLGGGDV